MNESEEFRRKKKENKSNCMIRITSLDMPKNDYLKFVRKVIYELNLRDEKEVIDEFPQDKQGDFNSKKKSILQNTDDINSNSVLEIKNILESDGKRDGDDSTPLHKNEEKKVFSKSKKHSKNSSKGNKNMIKHKEVDMRNVSCQMTPKNCEPPKIQKRDFAVSVMMQKNHSKKTNTASVS